MVLVVVRFAKEPEVMEGGGSAIRPVDIVVGLAPLRGPVATGVSASAVAQLTVTIWSLE